MSADEIRLEAGPNDDPGYVALVHGSLQRAARRSPARDVFVVRVRDWFGFSHTRLHALSVRQRVPSDDVLVPPFAPSRVLEARRFVRSADAYREAAFGPPLHVAQLSEENRRRNVARWSDDGLFLWYAEAGRPHLAQSALRASSIASNGSALTRALPRWVAITR